MQYRNAWSMILVWLAAGCAVTPTFTTGYRFEPQALRAEPLEATLEVERFVDARPPRKYTTQGRLFLTYVPLVPSVTLDFERIDETVPLLSAQIIPGTNVDGAVQNPAPPLEVFSYPQSMAQSVAADLAAHGLFREVIYAGEHAGPRADYILSGTLRETPLRMTATSYMLGMPGVLLWFLPLPMAKSSGAIALELTLTDRRSQATVWHETLEIELSRLDNMYSAEGETLIYGGGVMSYNMVLPPAEAETDRSSIFAWHFEALRRGMEQARPRLAAALSAR